jgi:hypothetical protein
VLNTGVAIAADAPIPAAVGTAGVTAAARLAGEETAGGRQSLVRLIGQKARQLELGTKPEGGFNALEGAGGARIEQVLGRTIKRSPKESNGDFIDRVSALFS